MLLRLSFACLIAALAIAPAMAQLPAPLATFGPPVPVPEASAALAPEPAAQAPDQTADSLDATALAPTPEPVVPPIMPRREARGLAAGAAIALGSGLLVILLAWGWGKRGSRTAKVPAARAAWLDETSPRVVGVASALPALRDALASTLRAVDRSYVLATAPARRAHEAWSFAQDLSEQAAGLHERLLQAQLQTAVTEAPQGRALGDRLTQLALDLALVATPEARAEQALSVASELRALGVDLAQQEPAPTGGAPWIPYLVELSASLQARCARLEGILGASESEETLAQQLRAARDALDRGIAQAELLADRVRTLEEALAPAEGAQRDV